MEVEEIIREKGMSQSQRLNRHTTEITGVCVVENVIFVILVLQALDMLGIKRK